MITKKQFAESIVRDYCRETGVKEEELSGWEILKSSSLAVAMEFLGMLKTPEQQEYAKNRGGTFVLVNSAEFQHLSTREMLGLLPDEIETEQ